VVGDGAFYFSFALALNPFKNDRVLIARVVVFSPVPRLLEILSQCRFQDSAHSPPFTTSQGHKKFPEKSLDNSGNHLVIIISVPIISRKRKFVNFFSQKMKKVMMECLSLLEK
jgi:hypothetical protein